MKKGNEWKGRFAPCWIGRERQKGNVTVMKCWGSDFTFLQMCWNVIFQKAAFELKLYEQQETCKALTTWETSTLTGRKVKYLASGKEDNMVAEKVPELWNCKNGRRRDWTIQSLFFPKALGHRAAILPFIVCWILPPANKVVIPRLTPRQSQSQAQNRDQSHGSTQNWNQSRVQVPTLSSALTHQPQRN